MDTLPVKFLFVPSKTKPSRSWVLPERSKRGEGKPARNHSSLQLYNSMDTLPVKFLFGPKQNPAFALGSADLKGPYG